jgi:hypothetical protein
MDEKPLEDDEAIATLINALAEQYRKQMDDPLMPISEVRLEIIRKLALVADAIKGLMKSRQLNIDL